MSEQLDQAYNLIKEGRKQDAISLLEPIIRADRDNENAWWLLANATDNADAKRNALNNVMRLTTNDVRQEKANSLLQQLDDPFAFDVEPAGTPRMSSYIAIDEVPKKQSGRFSCATISLIIVGLVGLCACAGIFALGASAQGIFTALSYPQNFHTVGIVEDATAFSSELSANATPDAYTLRANAGDKLTIQLNYESVGSPLVVIFQENSEVPLTFIPPDTSGRLNYSYSFQGSGNYLIVVSGFEFLGQTFGYGDYSIEFGLN